MLGAHEQPACRWARLRLSGVGTMQPANAVVRLLIRLGARWAVVAEIIFLVMLLRACTSEPACPECEPGGGGTSSTATGGSVAGSGGEPGGGAGSTMTGGTTAGGTGGVAGGSGGATGGTTGGTTGGAGGCVPSFACGPKDCGLVDNGCGQMLDCDHAQLGDPITCASELANQSMNGPMTCGADHLCHCVPEGNTPAAMALCQGANAEPAVADWCAMQGGCSTALCGLAPVPKVTDLCIGSGQALKPNPQDPNTWIHIWCCTGPG